MDVQLALATHDEKNQYWPHSATGLRTTTKPLGRQDLMLSGLAIASASEIAIALSAESCYSDTYCYSYTFTKLQLPLAALRISLPMPSRRTSTPSRMSQAEQEMAAPQGKTSMHDFLPHTLVAEIMPPPIRVVPTKYKQIIAKDEFCRMRE